MSLQDDLKQLQEAVLRRLNLERVEADLPTFEVVATAPAEEPLEEPMFNSLVSHLEGRLKREIEAKRPEGRVVLGFARVKTDYSDNADCESGEGEMVSAFTTGQHCYRIVLLVGTVDE